MTKVVLIERKSGTIVKEVETTRVEYMIDQLMRNRDPRLFIARKG